MREANRVLYSTAAAADLCAPVSLFRPLRFFTALWRFHTDTICSFLHTAIKPKPPAGVSDTLLFLTVAAAGEKTKTCVRYCCCTLGFVHTAN